MGKKRAVWSHHGKRRERLIVQMMFDALGRKTRRMTRWYSSVREAFSKASGRRKN